ncbi:MAG: hypothetical protein RLZZ175_1625 [Bacteroidota bacterium]|jgi:uncharacterized low-complexity protein
MKNSTFKSVLGTTILASSMFVSSANATSLFDFDFLGSAGEVRNELVAKSKGLDLTCGDKNADSKTKDAKCGEGKCGDKKDAKKDDKKADKKKEGKAKDAKCGEGKCGDKKK